MQKLINQLPPLLELVIILSIAFGLFIFGSIYPSIISNPDSSGSFLNDRNITEYTSQGLFFIVLYEVIALIIIMLILKHRDWKFSDFNLKFSFRLFLVGILLFYLSSFLYYLVAMITIQFYPVYTGTSGENFHTRNEVNLISIILLVIVNSIYEESILIGYLFKRLEKIHPALIIVFSLIIRELYHTYQGWSSLLHIIPTGLIFGLYYYKFRKLWPVIIAHGCHNIVAYSFDYFR